MTASRSLPPRALLRGLAFVFLLAGAARAVVAPSETGLEIDGLAAAPRGDDAAVAAARRDLGQSPAWLDWCRQRPGWRAEWNGRTRTLHRAYGPGLRIATRLASAAEAEAACRSFLTEASAITGVRAEELRLVAADHRLGRWYVVFDQVSGGLPVRGGRADVRVTDAGEVLLFGADWHRTADVARTATIEAGTALRAAAQGLGQEPANPSHQLVLVPRPQDAGFECRLAYEIEFETQSPLGRWLALVDAATGELLRRENRIRLAQLTGRVTAGVEPVTVGDPAQSLPLRDTRFNVGAGTTEFGFTDPDGNYDVTTDATDSVDVRVRLAGRFGRVFNQQLGRLTPAIDARMLPGSPRDFAWSDSNSRASERDAYYHALVAHTKIKELDPAFTGVDYIMPIVVDIFDRDCNAFYDGTGINFFGESGRCPNIARIADVVLHEYGHAITDRQYRPLSPSGAMHEGFSDYFAATVMNDPRIGVGFRGPGTILRTVDNTNTFPDDIVGEVHRDGLIIGGALWDLREALGAGLTDSLFHYARYGRADSFDDYLLDVLATDDDNGNIYDGTPHFDTIITAFSAHGIGDYSVQIAHAPEADTEDLMKPLTIDSVILSIFALDPTSLELHYAIDGGTWSVLPLAPTGMGVRQFAATIPMQPAGTNIQYYLAAADTAGHTAALPAAGAADPFEFRVGTDVTPPVLVHEPLEDQPLDSPGGFTLLAQATDNLDRGVASVRAEHSRNSPALDQTAQLVPDLLPRWVAALPPAGAALGDVIHYRLVAVDSAGAPNTTTAPPSGDYTFQLVNGWSRDLDADDAGFTPSGDWEWGQPEAGPTAFTGTNVWGTGVGGSYTDDTNSVLRTATVDLTGWTSAALVFWHWLDSEPFFDGGRVQILAEGDSTATLLVPSGGYPSPFVESLDGPGYNGDFGGWLRAEFDLSQYLGQTIAVEWRFATDAGVVDRGWFLDDVQIVARQVRSIPLAMRAESGRDHQVPLRWSPPAGIDPAAPGTPLLGYHVYRGDVPDLSDAVRLTGSPLPTAAYTDNTAVNGETYFYAASALYANGESELAEPAAGQPYLAEYAASVSALDVQAFDTAPDTTVTFTNTGTGFLEMNLWLGDATTASLDELRVAYTFTTPAPKPAARTATPGADTRFQFEDVVRALAAGKKRTLSIASERTGEPAGGGFQLVFTDPAEGPGALPDLHQLFVQESGSEVLFRITAHQNWGNPLADFNVVFGVDADANRGTGDPQGNDFYVIAGAFPFFQFQVPAVIVQGMSVLGVPTHVSLPGNANALEFGFDRAFLGGANRMLLSVLSFDPFLQVPNDFLPNPSATGVWLQPAAGFVSAPAGMPADLLIEFSAAVPFGHYAGKIFLETNAPADPVVQIPVQYHFASTPVAIADLAAQQVGGDVEVTWRTLHEQDVAAFRVTRSLDGGPFVALGRELTPSPGRAYVFRDRDLEPGAYVYRVAEVSPAGREIVLGTVEITVTRQVPAVTFLDPAVPNPFNPTTTLRFGVATAGPAEIAIFDARGRRVRTLWRAAHAQPGYLRVTWNGLDDSGHRVASGVYHARLQTGGRAITRRLTLLK